MIVPYVPKTADQIHWPDDYVSLDEGRLRVRPDWLDRFRSKGWESASAILEGDSVRWFRELKDRDNGTVDWADDAGAIRRLYVKRHRSMGRVSNAERLPGWHEAVGSNWCQQAGLSVAPVVAAGYEPMAVATNGRPIRRSFFMTEELADYLPADLFARDRFPKKVFDHRRMRFMRSLAIVARRLHSHGLSHRDFYWCHLFVREQLPGEFDVRLIDLQRVERVAPGSWRWTIKDLAQFLYSTPTGFRGRAELDCWWQEYARTMTSPGKRLFLRPATRVRAALYLWREGRSEIRDREFDAPSKDLRTAAE